MSVTGEQGMPTYSLVIPVYNEEQTLPELQRRITDMMVQMDGDAEVVLVDDGSSDRSYAMMVDISRRDKRFKVVRLSRNFGHQIAVTAGLDYARGQAVIVMDADLQDPPEVVLDMAKRWRQGYDVVYAVRERRAGESRFKRGAAALFYRLLNKTSNTPIPPNVGDFRLADRKVVDIVKRMRESGRFLRGLFAWIGFKQIPVYFHRAERFAGTTKYPLRKMLTLAADGMIGFSNAPLRWVLALGLILTWVSLPLIVIAILLNVLNIYLVSPWTGLGLAVAFFAGLQLTATGIIGAYLARMHAELLGRPLYITSETHGFDDNADEPTATEQARPE